MHGTKTVILKTDSENRRNKEGIPIVIPNSFLSSPKKTNLEVTYFFLNMISINGVPNSSVKFLSFSFRGNPHHCLAY